MSRQELVVAAAQGQANDAIDYLFFDLTTCERCLGSDRNLDVALELARDVLAATGATVEVAQDAGRDGPAGPGAALRQLADDPINGRDVALELKETSCRSEACSCADGGEPIACRVWSYLGDEHTEAPVGLIVDAILGELYGGVTPSEPVRQPVEPSSCCSAAEQESCCEPAEKASCCAPAAEGGWGADEWNRGRRWSRRGLARAARAAARVHRAPRPHAGGRRGHPPGSDAPDPPLQWRARAGRARDRLNRIASNAIVDYYRKPVRRKLPAGSQLDHQAPGDSAVPFAGEPDTAELRGELAGCLSPLLERVPASYRQALELTEIEGFTQAGAPARLGLSVSGMKTRVQRGRGLLKDVLLDCCHVELDRRGGVADYRPRRGPCECGRAVG